MSMAEKIYPSLLQIQSKLKAPKSQYNSFGKYKYRNAEDILQAAKPLNVKYNCVPVITSKISEINGASYVEVKIKLVQAEDGSSVEVTGFAKETDHKKGMDPAQVTGATFSYALKYALNGLYAIDDTKDVDTNEYRNEGEERYRQQQRPRKQQKRRSTYGEERYAELAAETQRRKGKQQSRKTSKKQQTAKKPQLSEEQKRYHDELVKEGRNCWNLILDHMNEFGFSTNDEASKIIQKRAYEEKPDYADLKNIEQLKARVEVMQDMLSEKGITETTDLKLKEVQ